MSAQKSAKSGEQLCQKGRLTKTPRFMFGKEQIGYFLPLALFSNMTSLNICGGDFYSDKLIDLLEQIGQRERERILKTNSE